MKVVAPGKLLLAGAYAVLEGAPALVVAIDRRAVADGDRRATLPTPEVLAALDAASAPEVDASALREGDAKLGLGSSAAILVASLGVAYARAGKDLRASDVRTSLFADARRAHARVQAGGSGVDVAASVHGGALEYALLPGGGVRVDALPLPAALRVEVFWCGAPATTTRMRARVDALREKHPSAHRARLDAIGAAAVAAVAASRADDLAAFMDAARAGSDALLALGRDADAPIFLPALRALVPLANDDGAAFLPSGAGGGDVFVHVGRHPASPQFQAAAAAAGLRLLAMQPDALGVRLTD